MMWILFIFAFLLMLCKITAVQYVATLLTFIIYYFTIKKVLKKQYIYVIPFCVYCLILLYCIIHYYN